MNQDTILIVALVSVLLLLTLLGYFSALWAIRRALTKITRHVAAGLETVEGIIHDNLRPTIYPNDNRDMVRHTAAKLILEACDQKEEGRKFVTFYGAASLSATGDENLPQDRQTLESLAEYNQALDKATRTHLRLTRYVSLFLPEELAGRSDKVRRQYLAWLDGQQNQILRDERYLLSDVVRAPKWGANMAKIITHTTVMEITGNGRAAVIIEDEKASTLIRKYAREAVLDGQNPAIEYGQSKGEESLRAFRAYVGSIKKTKRKRKGNRTGVVENGA